MRRTMSSWSRHERGAAAVEFALISMVLLSLVVYIMQFALWFWAFQVGAHSAREGARLGAVDPCNNADITIRVNDRVGSAATGTPTVAVTRSSSPVKVGDEVTVQVTYNVPEIANGFLPFTMPAIDKTATARIENVPAGGGGC